MRASATSRTNSPASISASPAKADTNKVDAASPFALLVEMATAKDGAKPAKKDAKDSSEKPADSKSAVKQNDGNSVKQDDNAAAAQAAPQPRPATSAKPGKPDKNKSDNDTVETVQGAPDDKQIAATEQQMSDQQALPPAPVVQAPIATSADTDSDAPEDVRIDGSAPIAKTAAPAASLDMSQPDPLSGTPEAGKSAPTQAASQTQASAQPDQTEDSETPDTVAAAAAATQAASADAKPAPKETGKPAVVKAASGNQPTGPAKAESAGVERVKDDLTGSAKDDNQTVQSVPAKPAKADLVKDDNSSDVALKGPAAHAGVGHGNTAKGDTDTSGVQKTDVSQADARPADADLAAAPAAAKPVPQSGSLSNTGFAINTIAAPQAIQNSQPSIAVQHVQVTAQTAPNLPALAVEIAAKSQSGAKQFDIRLDPPELGRVEVRLSIDATGKASAHLSADQPQTLALLQKDAPILTRALREAGLDVSQDGLNFSLRQQAHDQGGNDGNSNRFGNSRAFSLAATASIDPTASTIAYRGLVDGRLDIRV